MLKTITKLLYFVMLLVLSEQVLAQKVKIDSTLNSKLGIALNIGTTPGLSVAYRISPALSARLDGSFLKYNLQTTLDLSDEQLSLGGDISMQMFTLAAEYFPFKKSSFKLVGGATYINQGKAAVSVGPKSTYTYGESSFTPEEIGKMDFSADYGKSIAPFAAIGFGRTIPKRRIGVGAEFGLLYTKAPAVSLTGTERLSDMNEQEVLVQENMKDWRFFPVVNIKVAIRL